jgi:hypothetical protein
MFHVPTYWAAVTPSDSTALPPSVGLYVTGAGDVAFEGNGGASVVVTAVAAKSSIWADVRKVFSTGTTATGLFILVR